MADKIQELLDATDKPIIIQAFSLGGIILDRALDMLSPEAKERIYAMTYGSAEIIKEGKIEFVKNVISSRDLLMNLLHPIEVFRAYLGMSSNVTMLPSNTLPFIDHAILGPTYSQQIVQDRDWFKSNIRKE